MISPQTPDYLAPAVIASEQALLTCMTLDAECLEQYAPMFSAVDFTRDAHAQIFRALHRMHGQGRDVDWVTLTQEMEAEGRLEAAGGRPYLAGMMDSLSNVRMAPEHARCVLAASLRRRQVLAADEVMRTAARPGATAREVQELAERLLGGIGAAQQSETCSSAAEILLELTERLEARAENPSAMLGVSSGLRALDGKLNGLQAPNLIVIGARPRIGKSSLLTSICSHTALAGVPTLIFSMEMSREEVMLRMVCSMAYVDQHRLRSGLFLPDEYERYSRAAGALYAAPLRVDERSSATPAYMARVARRFEQRHGKIGLIGIDYVQLMRSDRPTTGRTQEMTEVSIDVKGLAREFSCPVVALAQVGRQVEARPDKRPQMSDIKESGQFEQDADIIAFLYDDYVYAQQRPGVAQIAGDEKRPVELIVAKHRNGPTGTVLLGFTQRYTRFSDWILDGHGGDR